MSSYTGLYVQRLSNGEIASVQVVDPFGNSLSLEPEIYTERQIKPPIEQLPDMENYKVVTEKPQISPIILELANWVKGQTVSADTLYKIQQFGFIYPDGNGKLQLTPSGKQILQEKRLV